jgi:hypothetical protein
MFALEVAVLVLLDVILLWKGGKYRRAKESARRDEEWTPAESFSGADLFAARHFTRYVKNNFAIRLSDFAQEPAKLLQNRCVLARAAPRIFVGRLPYAKSRRLRRLVAFVEK